MGVEENGKGKETKGPQMSEKKGVREGKRGGGGSTQPGATVSLVRATPLLQHRD